ncbi:MAG: alpha/beta hydrolase [Candidatus Saccharibacteria bacterium]|nr:alpha/beta hydrolase [Candidatus Saccharibacteria bacterium]
MHGLGVSGEYYLPFAEEVNDFYDVYIIDLPGYGNTPKPDQPLTIKELSIVLHAYIAQKKLSNVIVVGQSMGCQIIAHAVADNPTPFSKMILLAPTVNKNERRFFIQSFRLLQDALREPPSATLLVMRDYIRMGIRRYLFTTKNMIADHIEKTLAHCQIPVLIVYGKNDKIVPADWVNYLTKNNPNCTSVAVSNAPHLLHYKKPQELIEICRRFIEN